MKKERTIILTSFYRKAISWLIGELKDRKVQKIAFIMDAERYRLDKEPDYWFGEAAWFEREGFEIDFVELAKIEKEDLKKRLEKADAIYVKGGNAFDLLKQVRKSGFDTIISELLDKGVIYVGESAGSYLAYPTIEMACWKNKDIDTRGVDDLSALNIVPFLITVHYTPEIESLIRAGIEKAKHETRIITDNQAIIIEDGKEKLIKI